MMAGSRRDANPLPADDASRDRNAYLLAKVRKYTVQPAREFETLAPENIVLAQYGDPLARAFQLARELLDAGSAVRIVAPGITLARLWPSWVRSEVRLTLTEWGAFTPPSLGDATRGLEDEFRAWVRGVFGGEFGATPSERLFFAGACQRFFQRVLIAYPVARGIADAFPAARLHPVRRDALTADLIHQLRGVDEVQSPRRRRRLRLGLEVASLGLPALGAAIVRSARDYVAAAPTFRAIRAHRAASRETKPSTWVGVLPDWYRMNHHLLDAFALPETDDHAPLGVLFVGTLAPFRRDEASMRTHHASDLWPGLGQLRDRLAQCTVEQAVMPESALLFARSVGLGAARSCLALSRFVLSPAVDLPTLRVLPRSRDVLPWLTMDVLRATLGDEAGKSLLRRAEKLPDAVVFTGANNISWSPVDYALQAEGVTTADHPHGSGSDVWTGMCDSASAVRVVWTHADAVSASGPGVQTLVTGMPVRFRFAPRERRPRRVLLTSGYVHRDAEGLFGFPGAENPFPHRPFQAELLDVVRLLRERGHADLEFRWRPHPADNEAAMREDFGALTDVELSSGRSLEEDAGWADLLISSVSTVVIECLFAGIPVFVHVLPESDGLPSTRYITPERAFFRASDGAELVSRWLARFSDAPHRGLEPEARSREDLFGETGEPVAMTEYFGRHARRPVASAHVPQRSVT